MVATLQTSGTLSAASGAADWSKLQQKTLVEAVQRMEKSALADAGVDSYLGYVVGRVNDMMEDTESRRRRLALAEDHRLVHEAYDDVLVIFIASCRNSWVSVRVPGWVCVLS